MSCVAAECVYECLVGSVDCNGDPSDGCEVETGADPLNCGSCGQMCSASLPSSAGVCEAGECAFGCDMGWGDCNSDLWTGEGDGCEADLNSSAVHCGICSDPCPTGCVDGTCPGRGDEYCTLGGGDLVDPRELALAGDGSGFMAVVREASSSELILLRLDGVGRQVGIVDRFSDDDIVSFDIAHDGSHYVLVWNDRETNELRGARYDDSGTRTEAPTTLASGVFQYARVQAHDGAGEVVVGLREQAYWVSASEALGSGTTARALPGASDHSVGFVSPVADGYVGVGTNYITGLEVWPDGRWDATGTRFDASMNELEMPASLDPGLSVFDTSTATLVAAGGGSLFAASATASALGGPRLYVVPFDAAGRPSPPVQPVATVVGAHALGSDDFGAWLIHASADSAPAIHLRQLDTFGAATSWERVVATRGGFLREPEVEAGTEGALALWIWSSVSGGPDLQQVQGVFVARSDLSITRPCD